MNITREWYKSEFLQHELSEPHRAIESEFTFYEAIATGNIDYVRQNCNSNAFTKPDGMGKLSENLIAVANIVRPIFLFSRLFFHFFIIITIPFP